MTNHVNAAIVTENKNCSNCYYGSNTCKAGYTNFGSWSAWKDNKKCSSADKKSGKCQQQSRVIYK